MTPKEFQSLINDVLVTNYFTQHHKSWIRPGEGLSWLVSTDKPRPGRYAIDLGVDFHFLSSGERRREANDCHVIVRIHRLDLHSRLLTGEITEALDLNTNLDDDERTARIRTALEDAISFMDGLRTVESVRDTYDAGKLPRASFILIDARALLEARPE